MTYSGVRRKVFISHYECDRDAAQKFIDDFSAVFIPRVLGADENYDYMDCTDKDYVLQEIRRKYLEDTTVTIVLIGDCTHSRRYVDWEIMSSLAQGSADPNGLIGIILPYKDGRAFLPTRLAVNWNCHTTNCYAQTYIYPESADLLGSWIEDAHQARTNRNHLINNPQKMMQRNSRCLVHNVTH